MGKGNYITQSFVFTNLKTVLGITNISPNGSSGSLGDVIPSMTISGNKIDMTLMSYSGAGYVTNLTIEAIGY